MIIKHVQNRICPEIPTRMIVSRNPRKEARLTSITMIKCVREQHVKQVENGGINVTD